MLALDIGFDQSPLICRDLHPGNSIKPLHPCTDVLATLQSFVKDICKSKIGKWFSLLRFSLRLNVNAKTQDRVYLDSSEASGNAVIAVGPVDKQPGESVFSVRGPRCTYCGLPHPPAWWCWGGQTVPWWRPQPGSLSSVCRCIPLSESWWPHKSPSCWAASGARCTLLQTPLVMNEFHKATINSTFVLAWMQGKRNLTPWMRYCC